MERTFGQNLRALRTERGLSQEELAAQLGTTKQVVSRYENGQRTPKVTVVEAFARRLGVPLAALLGEAAAQREGAACPCWGMCARAFPDGRGRTCWTMREVPPSLAHLGELFALKIKGDSMEPRHAGGRRGYLPPNAGCGKRRHRGGAGERRRGHGEKS